MKRYSILRAALFALSVGAAQPFALRAQGLPEAEPCHEEGKDVLCGRAAATWDRLLAEEGPAPAEAATSDIDVDPFDLGVFTRCMAGADVRPAVDCGY